MIDYVDGKAAWLAEGLPAEGDVADDDRIGARITGPGGGERGVLDAPGDPWTVRPNELVRDVRERLRARGDDLPDLVHVTTAKGRLLGTIEKASLLARPR